MDGVLVDTMRYHYLAWRQVFKPLGIKISKLQVYKREGERYEKSILDYLKNNSVTVSPQKIKAILKQRQLIFKKILKPRLFKGVTNLVRQLKKKGFLLGLVTATPRNEINKILPNSLISSFDAIVSGDRVRYGKPHPEPYCLALKLLNIKPAWALVVENAPYGIVSAKRAKIEYVVAITTSLPRRFLKKADLIINSFSDLIKIL